MREEATTSLPDDIRHRFLSYAEYLRGERKFETALTACRRALAFDPEFPHFWSTYGNTLWNMGRLSEARGPMEKAATMVPTVGAYQANLGLLYHSLHLYDKSERCFGNAIRLEEEELAQTIDPERKEKLKSDVMSAIWDRSQLRLEIGDWKRGFEDFEIRIPLKGTTLYPGMPFPTWTGEDLSEKTLYIQAEQGIGDRILISRYFSLLKKRWPSCKIKICFNELLADLFWEYRELVEFLPHGVPWPKDVDYGIFAFSLPRVLGTTPDTVCADLGYIRRRLDEGFSLKGFNLPEPHYASLKVGIVWAGNPSQSRNHQRSIPLEEFFPLAENPGITLYSLQHNCDDISRLEAGDLICDLGNAPELAGYVPTGVAMKHLDLVIAVDTSAAHLAGAAGVPCIMPLGYDCYWIWQQADKPHVDNAWWPSIEAVRQLAPGDWSYPFAYITERLAEIAFEKGLKLAA